MNLVPNLPNITRLKAFTRETKPTTLDECEIPVIFRMDDANHSFSSKRHECDF